MPFVASRDGVENLLPGLLESSDPALACGAFIEAWRLKCLVVLVLESVFGSVFRRTASTGDSVVLMLDTS